MDWGLWIEDYGLRIMDLGGRIKYRLTWYETFSLPKSLSDWKNYGMEKENTVKSKSFSFAFLIVNTYKQLSTEHREFIMSKQLLKSGTSIGANVREALSAQSTADFIHKMSIALKECDETLYWLELLNMTDYMEKSRFDQLKTEANSLRKILSSIIITSKQNLKAKR